MTEHEESIIIDTKALRDKWSQWEDAALDPQSLRGDFLEALDEIDRLRAEIERLDSDTTSWNV